jgi:hypothetical protein
MRTATAVLALVDRLCAAHANEVVATLASAEVATSETAMGKSLRSAAELAERIDATSWSVFEDIAELPEEYQADATDICQAVRTAIENDEHAVALAAVLKGCQERAVRLLARVAKARPATPVVTPEKHKEVQPPRPGKKIISQGEKTDLAPPEAQAILTDLQRDMEVPSRRLSVTWRIDDDEATEN